MRSINIQAPGISVSFLEDKSIQEVHKQLGIEQLKPSVKSVDDSGRVNRWTKHEIIQEFGFPVLSKEIAAKIETLANPTDKNKTVRYAIFYRQDLLQLAIDLNAPVPEVYGTIERKEDGTLYTTKAQRTGCSMCGFGIHLEKRPHRFDLLKERNPKEWNYWMYECCTDDNGEKFGWARVLDYIGVGY